MDKRVDVIKELIRKRGYQSQKAFATKIGLPYTTLRSMLERGVGGTAVDTVLKVCKGLEITTEQLEEMAGKLEQGNDDIETIAAHHDGEEWTEEELRDIEAFKEYVRSRRKQREE